MSIANKLTYLEETKGLIKEKLNDLGAEITDDTFREYANKLDNIYNELPKATEEGSNITLENTKKGKMQIIPLGNTTQNTSILPSEYQQVEYIESTGTQYIDTGLKPTNSTGVYIKATTGSSLSINNQDSIVIGSRNSSGNRFFVYLPTYENHFAIAWKDNYIFGDITLTEDTNYTVLMNYNNDNKIYLNGNQLNYTFPSYDGNNFNMYIFSANNNGTSSAWCSCKLKELVLTNGTTKVRHYIPCYRKSNNEIGLYDLVNNTFYTNAGTGTFLKGNDVAIPNPDYPQPIKNVTGNNVVKITLANGEIIEKELNLRGDDYNYNLMKDDYITEDCVIHHKRKKVDLSILNWSVASTNMYYASLSNAKLPSSDNINPLFFAEKYISSSRNGIGSGKICISQTSNLLCYDATGKPTGILEYELENEETEIIPNTIQLYNQIKELYKTIIPNQTILVKTESEEENAPLIVRASALKG